jgi:hypothetical protein
LCLSPKAARNDACGSQRWWFRRVELHSVNRAALIRVSDSIIKLQFVALEKRIDETLLIMVRGSSCKLRLRSIPVSSLRNRILKAHRGTGVVSCQTDYAVLFLEERCRVDIGERRRPDVRRSFAAEAASQHCRAPCLQMSLRAGTWISL